MSVSAVAPLVHEACRQLSLNQKGLAELLGVTPRTLQRNTFNAGLSGHVHYAALVRALHPHNPELAEQIATTGGYSLAALGIHPPRPAAPSAPPPVQPTRAHVDSVLNAAADALGMVPKDAKPIVAAIFARVQELHVDVGALLPMLAQLRSDAKPLSRP